MHVFGTNETTNYVYRKLNVSNSNDTIQKLSTPL